MATQTDLDRSRRSFSSHSSTTMNSITSMSTADSSQNESTTSTLIGDDLAGISTDSLDGLDTSQTGVAPHRSAPHNRHSPQTVAQTRAALRCQPRTYARQKSRESDHSIQLQNLSKPQPAVTTASGEAARPIRISQSPRRSSTLDTVGTFISGNLSIWPTKQNEDGTRYLPLPESKLGYFVFIAHYLLLLCGFIAGLILQVLGAVTAPIPNEAQRTANDMQKFFGKLAHEDALQAHKDARIAHEDAKAMLKALKVSKSQQEAYFDRAHHAIKRCVAYVKSDTSAAECTEALRAINPNGTSSYLPMNPASHKLAKRKLEEIGRTLHQSGLPDFTREEPARFGNILLIFTSVFTFVFIISLVFILSSRARKLVLRLPGRVLISKGRLGPYIHEKADSDLDDDFEGSKDMSTTTQYDIGHEGAAGMTSRRGRPDQTIWEVASRGVLEKVIEFRTKNPDIGINRVDPKLGTLLAAAARSGNLELVSQVVRWGADLNQEGGFYHNALQSAAHSGNLEVVRFLLSRRARETSIGGYYGTALTAAIEKGDLDMVKSLIEYIDYTPDYVSAPGGLHGKALIAAAAKGHIELTAKLLEMGGEVNGINESDTTALHVAAAGDHLELVKFLLESGAAVDRVSSIHGTALHVACRNKKEKMASYLIRNGAKLNVIDSQGRTPIHEASQKGLDNILSEILSRDSSSINARDINGNTALHDAAIQGHENVTKILLYYKIDHRIGDGYEAQALFRAAGCQFPDVVKTLLEAGSDPNATDCYKQTALHGPSETDDVKVQQYLIDHGANVNAIGAWNRTPLYEACNMGRFENVKLLLSQDNINVNPVDQHQGTPLCRALCSTDHRHKDEFFGKIVLHMLKRDDIDVDLCNGLATQEAAKQGFTEAIKIMIFRYNANVHVHGGKYGGVLQAAAISGKTEIIQLLLDRKCNVNEQGGEFGTPLAAAAAFGHAEAVRLLLENGADASIRGAGRWGSAYGSVCKALTEDYGMKIGAAERSFREFNVKELLAELGNEDGQAAAADPAPHKGDRWRLMPNGWTFTAPGEM